MLQQTVDRRRALVSRERILVSLNSRHRHEAIAQLADLPEENLIFQPANLDTTKHSLALGSCFSPRT